MQILSDLFDIIKPVPLELINCRQCKDGIPFVSRTSKNNGVVAFIEEINFLPPMPGNAITVALGGSVLSSFYQEDSFYTAFHIAALYPKIPLTKEQMLFYAYIIEQNAYRYNYGRQANRTLEKILVPSTSELPPYTNKIKCSDYKFNKEPVAKNNLLLNTNTWETFYIKDLFEVSGTITTPKHELESYGAGMYPYITTQSENNGTEGFYDFYTEEGGVFTIDSAVAGFCAYQALPFSASDHVEKLTPKFNCGIYTAIFLTTLINMEQYKYNYGRKCSQSKIKEAKIKLPAAPRGSPDWQWIETYIKGLPYSKCL